MKYLLLFLVFSCSQIATHAPTPEVVTSTIPDQVHIPTNTVNAAKPYLTVTSCTNCTAEQWKFIQAANKKLNEVVTSQCFKDEVLKSQFLQGWTLGKNNFQVYESLVGADVKIEAEIYYSLKRVSGYTYPNQMKQWLNSRYLVQWGVNELASLLAHETSHKIGYGHTFNYTNGREKTIPYALNTIIERCD